jgi:predicted ATPase
MLVCYKKFATRKRGYLNIIAHFCETSYTPAEKYLELVANNIIKRDDYQLEALKCFTKLHSSLVKYDKIVNSSLIQPVNQQKTWNWLDLFSSSKNSNIENHLNFQPKSFYIWGGTGSGKVLLRSFTC